MPLMLTKLPFHHLNQDMHFKLFSESHLHSLASSAFQTISFRLFSIYGFGQRPDFVIPTFVNQALNKQSITVYGDGNQIRSFCHV